MLKMQIIGHIGKDAVMQQHGTDNVINFSVAHTDKFKANGVLNERTTWVECSWWIDAQSKVAQYLKKGTQVYVEGVPATRHWDTKDGKRASGLVLRVFSLQLLGGGQQQQQPSQQAPAPTTSNDQGGYVPHSTGSDEDLPF